MSERAANKADRLLQIERLLLDHPDGLTQSEIARRIGVHRSTINRYKPDLDRFLVYETDDGRLAIDRDSYLTEVRFTLHEAMAVHLAARLMTKTTDKQNPHAASALSKLAESLERLAPFISDHVRHAAEVMQTEAQRYDPVYLDVLETLTRAWSLGHKVKLTHQMDDGNVYTYTFAPYYIEPYPLGRTSHVIGWREPPDAVRTFKIERIRTAEMIDEPYTIPTDFDPAAHLADAWGIWTRERAPVEVVLRFHPRVVRRVQETRWHRNEQTELQPDGWLIWRAPIAEPREMLPWVRGWGGDVTVIEPPELRARMVQEAVRLSTRYGVTSSTSTGLRDRLLRCWGKTGASVDDFHPAIFHMLDVANVARALLNDSASSRWAHILSATLNASPETLKSWLPYVIALHDLGKISASFQSQNAEQMQRLKTEGFPFEPWHRGLYEHHTQIGRAVCWPIFETLGIPRRFRRLWMALVGGHHGVFQPQQGLDETEARLAKYEPDLWQDLRTTAEQTLREALLAIDPETIPAPETLPPATMALTGFTILCDWLGSDARIFQPASDLPWDAYRPISEARAARAVARAGFTHSTLADIPPSYSTLFPDKLPPRPLQAAVDRIPDEVLAEPCLAIIEAPTGEGKTEAALTLAHRIAQATGTDEIYYALPTTATSNQMFKRLHHYLGENLNLATDIQLIHGQAYLMEDDLRASLMSNGDAQKDTVEDDAVTWFTSKKRAILAPFGVGTVDQAELAALNTKHVALRLIGLAGKVLIFDEVHAYDTYMTTIVERLLRWLATMGTSVILLSATLPVAQRRRLIQAYGADNTSSEDAANGSAYPNLSVSRAGLPPYHAHPAAYRPDREVNLETLHLPDDDPAAKAAWLLEAVADGGCACWITNTVNRAQQIYDALRNAAEGNDVARTLIHARFPLEERMARELRLAEAYGPDGERPERGIVIGTQVLEQSLDLDFDVMVSDLAPVDLLLQRAGRLQRHDVKRPARYENGATLWVQTPLASGEDALGVDAYIYDAFLLRQTWAVVRDLEVIHLPADYRALVEAVYGDQVLDPDPAIAEAWERLQQKQAEARRKAEARLIPKPESGRAFFRSIAALTFEEDETGAAWTVAQTRLGRESVSLIPLYVKNEGGATLLNGTQVPLDRNVPVELQLEMLRQQVRVSHPAIVEAIKRAERPRVFEVASRLRNVHPLALKAGSCIITSENGHWTLTLDPELGLIIRKESA